MSLVFIDFEASSLARGSFPIEVGWVTETGVGTSVLIRPEPGWLQWSTQSQRIHNITREDLNRDGIPAKEAARLLVNALEGNIVLADEPAWDGAWLNMLLSTADCTACKVEDLDQALIYACQPLLALLPPESHRDRAAMVEKVRGLATKTILDAKSVSKQILRVRHRALPDAMANWSIWKEVGEKATVLADDEAFQR